MMLSTQNIDMLRTAFANGLSEADSPEEAARRFEKLATAALGQIVADLLKEVVLEVSRADLDPNIASTISGWQKHITGASIQIDWPSPSLQGISNLPVLTFSSTSSNDAAHAASMEVVIGVNIRGTF